MNRPHFIQFCTLTGDEWLRFSVCEVNHPVIQGGVDKVRKQENSSNQTEIVNDRLGSPYDERIGILENGKECLTCQKDNKGCPGHFGHIVLPIPVYNKQFSGIILKILNCICPICARIRILPENALVQGLLNLKAYKRLDQFMKRCKKIDMCPWGDCNEPLPIFDFFNKEEFRRYFGKDKSGAMTFTAGEALNIFLRISDRDLNSLGFNSYLSNNELYTGDENLLTEEQFHIHQFRPESLIFTIFPVIPPAARSFVMRDGQKCDDDITDKYNSILKLCIKLREDAEFEGICKNDDKRRNSKKMKETEKKKVIYELENHIWTLINNKDEKSTLSSGKRPHKSLTQRLVSKEGHIQSNVGGKRVDFSARTVIVGGAIMLKGDELGVSEYVAKELTIPEKAKEWNISYLQSLVGKGKVNRIKRIGEGGIQEIKRLSQFPDHGKSFQLRIDDIVERQLQNGDTVIFNRQPTLRVESMMSFKVKIISGYVFRLNLFCTPSFNADFDGDEMNLHDPQGTQARSEMDILSRVAVQLVTGQRNSPVNGIVQDGLVGGYLLTNTWEGEKENKTMVKTSSMMNIITSANISQHRFIDLLRRAKNYYPGCISSKKSSLKISVDFVPGNLIASIIFPPNFCYRKVTNVNSIYPEIKIENGVLLPDSGPLCKQTIGSKVNSIIHVIWKEYSPETTLQFLSECQLIIDYWLPEHGFSMGISDCLTLSKKDISKVILETAVKVNAIIISSKEQNNGKLNDEAEAEINSILNSAMNIGLRLSKTSMAGGIRNALNVMKNSGAKGSVINLTQIVAFLGQQNIDGSRIPCSLSNKTRTLTQFEKGDNSAEARGFCFNSLYHGLSPSETFFHAAGGRQGVISTAIKSVTGDTPILITENGKPRKVKIGDWINTLLENFQSKVEYYTEREMELLKIKNKDIRIPTVNEDGNVSWGKITAITRHNPGNKLYKIKTLGGRSVIVTESKSLLIWNDKENVYQRTSTPNVKIGDYVPTTLFLPEHPKVTTSFINLEDYLPKTEFIFGTDFQIAKNLIFKDSKGKVPKLRSHKSPLNVWWEENNGRTFILPYTDVYKFLRVVRRSDISNINKGYVYPFDGKSKVGIFSYYAHLVGFVHQLRKRVHGFGHLRIVKIAYVKIKNLKSLLRGLSQLSERVGGIAEHTPTCAV